jgi:hypothetical protein
MTNEKPAYMRQRQKLAPPGQQILRCIPMFGAYLFPVRYTTKTTTTRARSAPVGRGEGAPLLFSLYISQETGRHHTWVFTTKSAALEGPIFGAGAYMVVPHCSLLGQLRLGFMSIRSPHDFKSNDWIKSKSLSAHTGTRRLIVSLETLADTLKI